MGFLITDVDQHVAVATFQGEISHSEMIKVHQRLYVRYNRRGCKLFVDLTEAKLCSTAEQIRQLPSNQVFHSVAICAPGEFAYGMVRMYQLLTGDRDEVAVFKSRDEAMSWLVKYTNAANATGGS